MMQKRTFKVLYSLFLWSATLANVTAQTASLQTVLKQTGIEAFDLPPSCQSDFVVDVKANPSPVRDGEKLKYTISVTNKSAFSFFGVTIKNLIPDGTTYISGSASDIGKVSDNMLIYTPVTMEAGETILRTFEVTVNKGAGTTLLFADDMENGAGKWTVTSGALRDKWLLNNKNPRSGTNAWFAKDPDNLSEQQLILAKPVAIQPGALLRFWHSYATEHGFDGGKVEITADGGVTWEDLGSAMIHNGYNGQIPLENSSSVVGPAFTGNSNGYIETIADLNAWAGKLVQIRFRMGSDVLTGATGWFVDDVDILVNPVYVINKTLVTLKQGVEKTFELQTIVMKKSGTSSAMEIGVTAQEEQVIVDFRVDEQDNSFELQRSIDNIFFEAIKPVVGGEWKQGGSHYRFIDKDVSSAKTYYYRVISTKSLNSNPVSSEVVKARPGKGRLNIALYPNPAQSKIYIRFGEKAEGKVDISLINVYGQRILNQILSGDSTVGPIELDLPAEADGIYYLEINADGFKTTEKVLIRK